jgi:hypothetical protein
VSLLSFTFGTFLGFLGGAELSSRHAELALYLPLGDRFSPLVSDFFFSFSQLLALALRSSFATFPAASNPSNNVSLCIWLCSDACVAAFGLSHARLLII